ncbi:hypothetical protein [Streptomyces halobius]|uniref:Secreted protein n=1 Tax=Streptomyces halobius TaxID=2879846 RepID=A0ABY4M0A6_9ACTN|nr:hypothetical protein [Streptomyces halobius]UQA90872.1 hypothetical protein K9S39_02350 [Streptomyces halobius]
MRKLRPGLAAATVAAAAVTTLAVPAGASAAPNKPTAVTVESGTQAESAKARCTHWKTLRISKGHLTYKACKSRGYIKVTGHLHDTRRDGRAVYGKVRFRPSGHKHYYRATDRHRVTSINTGWHRARSVVLSIR